MISSRRKAHISEKIAAKVLELLGYRVIEFHKPVFLGDKQISEIDIVAEDSNGNTYAVEVKAGKLDVNGVRQAYINAKISGLKPIVVCKGFADDASKLLAEQLGVKVIELSDLFIVEPEELTIVVRTALESTIRDFLRSIYILHNDLTSNEKEFIKILTNAESLDEVRKKLNISEKELMTRITMLKKKGVVPMFIQDFRSLAVYLRILLKFYDYVFEFEGS